MAETIHDVAEKISDRQYGAGTVVNVSDGGPASTYIDFDTKDSTFGEAITVGDEGTDWYATGVEKYESDKYDFDYRVWYQQCDSDDDAEDEGDDNSHVDEWDNFFEGKSLSDSEVAAHLQMLAERADSDVATHDCNALSESLKLLDASHSGSQKVVIAHGIAPHQVDYHVGKGRDVSDDRDFTADGIYAPVGTESSRKIKNGWHYHTTTTDDLQIKERY